MKVPETKRESFVETVHGTEIDDPYRWLEDHNDPEVKQWGHVQDSYARHVLGRLPTREGFLQRVKGLLYVEESFAPVTRSDRLFYKLQPSDQEKPVYYWRPISDETPRVLLDPNSMQGNASVSLIAPSWSGRLVAYVTSKNNRDWGEIRIRNIESGADLSDSIGHLFLTEIAWSPDDAGFHYVWYPGPTRFSTDERFEKAEVRFHRIGTPVETDVTILGPAGHPSRWYDVRVSSDRRFLVITSWFARSSTEVFLAPLAEDPVTPVRLIGSESAHYFVDSGEGGIYILTDEGAPRGRVLHYPSLPDGESAPIEIVAEDSEATLEQLRIVGDRIALRRVWRAHSQIEVRTLDGRLQGRAVLPTVGRVTEMIGGPGGRSLFVTFESYDRPRAALEISLDTLEVSRLHKARGPTASGLATVEQVVFSSKDGTRVPMFIVRPRDSSGEGERPTILFGYGAFGLSRSPRYNPLVIAWVEQGGLYAVANIRGGGEFGTDWHKAGMLANKQNTIDDFIAASEWLIREGYTSSEHLAIRGGSGGGAAIGGAMTQRPELYKAVLCLVPVLDMLRHHKSGTAKRWIPEYGDPDDPREFEWLLSYSPYHHIAKGVQYPAMLMISADEDERVDPMHARKFVAALQWATAGAGTRVLLRVQQNAGHLGADLRREAAIVIADQLAFAFAEIASDKEHNAIHP